MTIFQESLINRHMKRTAFEIEIYCNINFVTFTVTSEQFNISLLLFKKILHGNNILNRSVGFGH